MTSQHIIKHNGHDAHSRTLVTAKPSQTQNIEPKSTGVPHDPTVHGSSVFLLFAYRDGRVAWRGPGVARRGGPRRTHRDKTQYTRRGWVRQPKHYHEDESGEANHLRIQESPHPATVSTCDLRTGQRLFLKRTEVSFGGDRRLGGASASDPLNCTAFAQRS